MGGGAALPASRPRWIPPSLSPSLPISPPPASRPRWTRSPSRASRTHPATQTTGGPPRPAARGSALLTLLKCVNWTPFTVAAAATRWTTLVGHHRELAGVDPAADDLTQTDDRVARLRHLGTERSGKSLKLCARDHSHEVVGRWPGNPCRQQLSRQSNVHVCRTSASVVKIRTVAAQPPVGLRTNADSANPISAAICCIASVESVSLRP